MFNKAESKLMDTVISTTRNFRAVTKTAEKMICKNLLFSFISSLILLAAAIGGYLYVQNYRDGTKIAEAKAIEALAKEKAKIEEDAVFAYKNSNVYREDACKFVAGNITKIDCLHYIYMYIKSDDIKSYPELKSFYNDFLKRGHEQYKRSQEK